MLSETTCLFIKLALRITMALSLILTPFTAWSNPNGARVIIETNVSDIDSTRLTLDFEELSFEELGDLPQKLKEHSNILPSTQEALRVHVFVPARLEENVRSDFLKNVEEQMRKSNPQLRIEIQAVELDVEASSAQAAEANARLESVAHSLHEESMVPPEQADLLQKDARALQAANKHILSGLQNWGSRFKETALNYNHWRTWWKSGYTKSKDERIGGWIGGTRGLVSAMVWFGFNNIGIPAVAQVSASFYLDWFFSKYERKVDIFKSTHRIPLEKVPILGYAVRFYNERPVIKSWVVGNLIGFGAGSYFRFWSWMENPERTSPPWSMDAVGTFTSMVGIGQLASAFGSLGPRVMRKKGYISSRSEYYIYVSYGIMFQMGGFLYGLGLNVPAIAFSTGETLFKVGLYGLARTRPWKDPRAFVFHPDLANKEVEELLYRVGLEKSETTSVRREDLPAFVQRLKEEQSISWKTKVLDKIAKIPGCAFLLKK